MNSFVVYLCVVAVLMRSREVSATEKIKIVSGSMDKRTKVFQQLQGQQHVKSPGSLDGADPDGIFQHCTCTSDTHVNCVCQGKIATGVTASMAMKYLPQTAGVDVEVKCNGDIFFAQGNMNPDADVNHCALEKACGGANVKMCFRLYRMTSADEEGTAPHGCNDVTVTINGGQEIVYTECMPGAA
ncbi:uncharacterized protein LOC119735781 [Patiria miniata]|uniref:Secreted protein n=1 Tax=Patiria miniata TaxID=46514 RepID=A0A914APG0_PATMI|nr:uncharacterized protein LOC119735781 [Patiria miniata]